MTLTYGTRLATGRLSPEQRLVYKFGVNHDCDTAGHEDIHRGTGAYPGFIQMAAASTVEAISDAAADAAGLAGARTIYIEGLDAAGDEQNEILTMAGLTASAASAFTYSRLHRAHVASTGTYHGSNAGTISIRDVDDSPVRAVIYHDGVVGFGQTQMAIYTVPRNHRALIETFHFDVEGVKTADIYIWQCPMITAAAAPYGPRRLLNQYNAIGGHQRVDLDGGILIGELTDVWVSAVAAANDTVVNASFTLILEEM